MTATLPSSLHHLPQELVASWSAWRPSSKASSYLTPPPSERRKPITTRHTTVLPSVADLERQIQRPAVPATEPRPQVQTNRLPPIKSTVSQDTGLSCNFADYVQGVPASPPTQVISWFAPQRTHSTRFLAEKTCEMICYMWFSRSASPASSPVDTSSAPNPLQLSPTPAFVHFMHKVLETTQVSESVIVLSLRYVYRLKERNRLAYGMPGSEFRVSVAALMLANKFVDDNTYTNKTWSEVSGIALNDINQMEREYLRGLNYELYVDKSMYDSWLKLLKGLVLAKERALRDMNQHRQSRRVPRPSLPRPLPSMQVSPTRENHRTFGRATSYGSSRARSSSPCHAYRPAPAYHQYAAPAPSVETTSHTGSKRSAVDAFSPTDAAALEQRPSKRPLAMSLEIPEPSRHLSPQRSTTSVSPVELASFGRLSLGSAAGSPMQVTSAREGPPHALMAAYRVDPARQPYVPEELEYYTISSSPTERPSDTEVDEADRASRRRARLRSHQPPALSNYAQSPAYPPYKPQVVQSARTSPRDVQMAALAPLPGVDHPSWAAARRQAPYTHTPLTPLSGIPSVHSTHSHALPPVYSGEWTRGRTL